MQASMNSTYTLMHLYSECAAVLCCPVGQFPCCIPVPNYQCLTGRKSSLQLLKRSQKSVNIHAHKLMQNVSLRPWCTHGHDDQTIYDIFYFLHLHTNQAQMFPVTSYVLWAISFKQQVPTRAHTYTHFLHATIFTVVIIHSSLHSHNLWCINSISSLTLLQHPHWPVAVSVHRWSGLCDGSLFLRWNAVSHIYGKASCSCVLDLGALWDIICPHVRI